MSVTLPDDVERETFLLSPRVSVTQSNCLSFYVYFNISSVIIRIGLSEVATTNYTSTIGVLSYPFSTNLFKVGESSCLFKIRLMIPTGSYHLIFAAKGRAGSISIWDVKQLSTSCTSSSKCYS